MIAIIAIAAIAVSVYVIDRNARRAHVRHYADLAAARCRIAAAVKDANRR